LLAKQIPEEKGGKSGGLTSLSKLASVFLFVKTSAIEGAISRTAAGAIHVHETMMLAHDCLSVCF